MKIDVVNIITILCVVLSIWTLVLTIREVIKVNKRKKEIQSQCEKAMSDYDKILRSTYGLENSRERNTGVHFDDEVVYLNRADVIRKNSPLFTWINEC